MEKLKIICVNAQLIGGLVLNPAEDPATNVRDVGVKSSIIIARKSTGPNSNGRFPLQEFACGL